MAEDFHHALKFKYDLCIGCSHCTGVCPTSAIHVEDGHPVLDPNRCVDCGRCYVACPMNAIYIEQDDFQTVYDYKYPVLLVPSIFLSQFEEKIRERTILSALLHLGFKDIYEVEKSVDFIKEYLRRDLERGNVPYEKPVISSFCPAIVRLIQVKFPVLVDNIYLVKAPFDMTAEYIKKSLTEKGVKEEDIGIFYVSPCAAKIAAIKSPVGEEKSPVSGVINMNYLYSKVLRVIKTGEYKMCDESARFHRLSKASITYPLTGGETKMLRTGRNLAIDDIHNVSEFLEKVEDEDIQDIDFLELRACDGSCCGGILTAENRFLMIERQRKRMAKCSEEVDAEDNDLLNYFDYLADKRHVGEVEPRSMDKMDDNVAAAMQKMKRAFEINQSLPQVDCHLCGYPSCKALADAVVTDKAQIQQCIFVQRAMEHYDMLTPKEAHDISAKVWGAKKTDPTIVKNLNL